MQPRPTLAELLEFPCDYLFKAFGAAGDATFAEAVVATVNATVTVPRDAVKLRPSSNGTYQCVTVMARLHNRAQLEEIYLALQRIDGLLYLL